MHGPWEGLLSALFFLRAAGRPALGSSGSSYDQYALPQYTIFFAGFPQQTHFAPSGISCSSNGMQREVAVVSALIWSSQETSSHQNAFTKPGFSSRVFLKVS